MQELTALRSVVPLDPWVLAVVEASEVVFDNFERLGLLANSYNLTWLNLEGSDVNDFTVNGDVLVTDELTCSAASWSDTETINYVVETALEELQEHLTSDTVSLGSLLKQITELALKYTVCVLSLLLLCQHDTILRSLATTIVAMLSRSEVSLGQNFFFTEDGFTKTTVNS